MTELNHKLIDKDIAYTKLPKEIIKELNDWKKECDKIKKHPLFKLKLHENVGSQTNHYQTSIPSYLIENSYWLAYVLRLCGILAKEEHRNFFIRKWDGHFDGYDVWINYAYKNNSNSLHNHRGYFSGVIYFNNKKEELFLNSPVPLTPLEINKKKVRFGTVGATGGILAGILGIGGGTAIVPLLHKACKFPLKTSIGTSSGMMIVTAAIGSIAKLLALPSANLNSNTSIDNTNMTTTEFTSVFLEQASEPVGLAAALIPTAIIGSWLGATLLNKLPVHVIRVLFTFFVAIASYKMLSG